jgi:tetratricopeptide (TPR) repeat protein
MVTEEWKIISESFITLRSSAVGHAAHLGFCQEGLRRCNLSRITSHFRFLMVFILSCLIAMCITGCEHSEPSPVRRYPWIGNDPNDSPQATLWESYIDEGRQVYGEGRYEEAEQLFKEAVREAEKFGQEDYRSGQSLYWLGAVVWDLGRPEEAQQLLERALRIVERLNSTETNEPSRLIVMADILVRLSVIEANNENYSFAKALANKAAKISREVGNTQNGRAHKQLLSATLKTLIDIQAKSGDYNGAVRTFSELIPLDPNNASYYYSRALLCKHTGEYESAVVDLTKVLELLPSNPQALNELAWILSTCKTGEVRDGRRSVELAQKAVEITKSKNPQYLDTLAAAYAETGQFDLAVKTQQKAISLLTDQEEIKIYLTKLRLYVENKPCREVKRK